jgi:hypothetical protein
VNVSTSNTSHSSDFGYLKSSELMLSVGEIGNG